MNAALASTMLSCVAVIGQLRCRRTHLPHVVYQEHHAAVPLVALAGSPRQNLLPRAPLDVRSGRSAPSADQRPARLPGSPRLRARPRLAGHQRGCGGAPLLCGLVPAAAVAAPATPTCRPQTRHETSSRMEYLARARIHPRSRSASATHAEILACPKFSDQCRTAQNVKSSPGQPARGEDQVPQVRINDPFGWRLPVVCGDCRGDAGEATAYMLRTLTSPTSAG